MVFVVEYDIPETPKLRQRFYRAIKKYLAENNIYGRYSTQSVVITRDYNFACLSLTQLSESAVGLLCMRLRRSGIT